MSFLKKIAKRIILKTPILRAIIETAGTANPITFKYFFFQKILGFNRNVPWPVHFTSIVSGEEYIDIGINTAPGASISNYIFATSESRISIGDYTAIASNVCIGSVNHDVYNISQYTTKGPINIGNYCWIGSNSVILSGVILGDHTVVAAGSVVTSPFECGYCIIAGNPAKIVKHLAKEKVIQFNKEPKYKGYKRL